MSSLVLVAAVNAEWVPGEIRLRRLPPEALSILSFRIAGFIRALPVVAIVAALLNASGILFAPQAGAYFFAVLCPLLIGTVAFVRMVFIRPAV